MTILEASSSTRQRSSVTLGGVTLLLVVAFALNASAGLRDIKRGTAYRTEVARSVAVVEAARTARQTRTQRQVPTATIEARRQLPSVQRVLTVVTPPAPVTAPAFAVPVLKADLPPPAAG
ncbi:MAG: hypothetical protein HBSAPP03_28800 [Phycisphaerae bacterium]|nr:MAG: hypothetical protein HBSAPP03_28800 [Phycisphaerae bacterium]